MSTIFDRLGAVLVTWYPHFAWHTFQFPRASPHLALMRRICAAAAGCALRKIRPEATGYVGVEGHVLPLALMASALALFAIVLHAADKFVGVVRLLHRLVLPLL